MYSQTLETSGGKDWWGIKHNQRHATFGNWSKVSQVCQRYIFLLFCSWITSFSHSQKLYYACWRAHQARTLKCNRKPLWVWNENKTSTKYKHLIFKNVQWIACNLATAIIIIVGLTLIIAWISNHMPSKVWDEITSPFQTSMVQL